ncbi:ABC transporter permease subunit [Synechococcus sp. OH20]|uniref:ABC transporter permease subunit n=1 Tax=Synechococcus sp. OH20 TaxID=139337 RepID=UPI0039C73B61
MNAAQLVAILSTAIATATPLVFASVGETITERAGVINLSAEGTIMLAAMVGFAVAKLTGSLVLGFWAAAAGATSVPKGSAAVCQLCADWGNLVL